MAELSLRWFGCIKPAPTVTQPLRPSVLRPWLLRISANFAQTTFRPGTSIPPPLKAQVCPQRVSSFAP